LQRTPAWTRVISDAVNSHHQQRGSREKADEHLAARARLRNAVADVHCGESQMNTRGEPNKRPADRRSAALAKREMVAKRRTIAAAQTPSRPNTT